MANTKISGMTAAAALTGTELLPLVQGGANVKSTAAAVAALSGPGGSTTQVQYNNAGAFAGITGATTNGTKLILVGPDLGTPASGVATNLTGTAASLTAGNATKLTTGRTISITGDVAYTSPSFDGSGNVTAAGTVSANIRTRPFGTTFGSVLGSALVAGDIVYVTCPFAGTISAWNICVDAGTCTVDIWKIASGTAIPTVANTITAAALPALSANTAARSTTLTGWTTAVAANDIFAFDLSIVATAKFVSIVLEIDQ